MHPRLRERIDEIEADDVHGASWLARVAVETVVEAVELGEDPVEVGRAIVERRPALGAVAGALGRVLAAGRTPEQVIEEAHALVAQRERAAASIAVQLRPIVEGAVIMTHSASATIREALLHNDPERVVFTVTEPDGEGRALAEEMRAQGITADVVEDSDATTAVGTCDLVLVGADTIFRDGSLLNRAGTAAIAEAARKAGVTFVVACEAIKLAPVDPIEHEDRFDLTPPELIDSYMTEEGRFAPDEIAALIDRTPMLHEGWALLAGTRRD